jgi:hypothetical protein
VSAHTTATDLGDQAILLVHARAAWTRKRNVGAALARMKTNKTKMLVKKSNMDATPRQPPQHELEEWETQGTV